MFTFWELFKCADSKDVALMAVGTLGAVVNGLRFPAVVVVHSVIYNKFGLSMSGNSSLAETASKQAIIYLYIAFASGIAGYLQVSCWATAGDRQARKLRLTYVRSLLVQDVSYLDCKTSTSQVIYDMSSSILAVQEATGEKMGSFIFYVAYFIGALLMGLTISWRIMVAVLPFLLLSMVPEIIHARSTGTRTKSSHTVAAKAGFIAKQALSSIRVVFSFTGEKKTMAEYSRALDEIVKVEKTEGLTKGLAKGSTALCWVVWAFIAWYGSVLITRGQGRGIDIFATSAAFLFCSRSLGNAAECIQAIAAGQVALERILRVIKEKPSMDVTDTSKGTSLTNLQGRLTLKSVSFCYPSRTAARILDGFNLEIPAGKVTALVGRSGSGKSTVLALLERFYDPMAGEICLDGVPIKTLKLSWYRHQIGLVSQEPSLFSTSIKKNIMLGDEGATMDDVIAAAQKANAHNFIMALPEGYDTQVGEKGAKLSGGQKQRIAIARAVIRKPSIMLLDEATSALDNESEVVVQAALDKVCANVTTVTIAHRLNSIKNADYVAVVQSGKVVEFGLQTDLISNGGEYASTLKNWQKDRKPSYQPPVYQETEQSLVHFEQRQDEENSLVHDEKHPVQKISFITLLKLNAPEWKQGCFGVLFAMTVGLVFVINPAIKSYVVAAFYSQDKARIKQTILITSIIRVISAGIYFGSAVLEHYFFGLMGACLTRRMREKMLERILHFEVGWFDREENSTGRICSRLATEPSMLRTLVGDRIYLMVETTVMVTLSLVLSFTLSWRLAAVVVALQPFVAAAMYIRLKAGKGYTRKAAKSQHEVSHIANDGLSQHRVVTAYSLHNNVTSMLKKAMDKTTKKNLKLFQVAGITYGIGGFTLFISFYITVWYGGHLITRGLLSFGDFLITFSVLVHMGVSISETLIMTPDAAASMAVAGPVLETIHRRTEIDTDEEGKRELQILSGRVEYENVTFAYPTRRDVEVLKSFNLVVKPGETSALVGSSGSGKSSVIALLQRFYDPVKGRILVDGVDIKTVNLRLLRQQIGLVSQEPSLFATTIRNNIAYGVSSASDSEVIEAATIANAHKFISALPEGYETYVGEGGAQLSGGQKQRIAIARAILKRPAILLLDEATSALDGESESQVQEALDKYREAKGRTTIVVAHRLSTIQHADTITVLKDGNVSEQGTHGELINTRGVYYSLVQSQLT